MSESEHVEFARSRSFWEDQEKEHDLWNHVAKGIKKEEQVAIDLDTDGDGVDDTRIKVVPRGKSSEALRIAAGRVSRPFYKAD